MQLRMICLCGALIPVAFLAGCGHRPPVEGPVPCSAEWFEFVEESTRTSDSQGHGPDPGSSEWRSVVEFKLGIRDDPKTPEPSSEAWCRLIDELVRSE